MLEDYKYKDLMPEMATLEKQKASEWAMYHAVDDAITAIKKSYKDWDADQNHILTLLKIRKRDLNTSIDDIDEKIVALRMTCKHNWIDITEHYDNHDVIKCKKCGNYKV